MHNQSTAEWKHEHTFGQDRVRPGERSTLIVIVITATMMIAEILAGFTFGSMALLADGIHMGSHAVALGISAIAYLYVRKFAGDDRFNFGSGKVNSLAGHTSAIILAVFALAMAWESLHRLINPVNIVFNQAILVASVGLVVNLISVWLLKDKHSHSLEAGHAHQHGSIHSDHNLRSAYLHVLADAMTSLLAIFALVGGKFFGFVWLDPLMGLVGAALVGRWSLGLIRDTSQVLLDHQGPEEIRQEILNAIESHDDNRICDLHLWSIGPDIFAAAISIVTNSPKPPNEYKKIIPNHLGLVHATIEIHRCETT